MTSENPAEKPAEGPVKPRKRANAIRTREDAIAHGLKPWRPGVSPNPGGRPATLTDMRRALEAAGGAELYRKAILQLAAGQSADGSPCPPSVQLGAAQELGNRLYGRPEQAISVTGESAPLDSARAELVAALLRQLRAPDVTGTAKELPEKEAAPAPEGTDAADVPGKP